MNATQLAIVVPCYNEQEVLPETVARMTALLGTPAARGEDRGGKPRLLRRRRQPRRDLVDHRRLRARRTARRRHQAFAQSRPSECLARGALPRRGRRGRQHRRRPAGRPRGDRDDARSLPPGMRRRLRRPRAPADRQPVQATERRELLPAPVRDGRADDLQPCRLPADEPPSGRRAPRLPRGQSLSARHRSADRIRSAVVEYERSTRVSPESPSIRSGR